MPQPRADLPKLAAPVARMNDVAELRETVQGLLELVQDLADPDSCILYPTSRHVTGGCMSHRWYQTDPACTHARAKAVLTEAGMEQP